MTREKQWKWCNSRATAGLLITIGILNTIVASMISLDRILLDETGRELEKYVKLPMAALFYFIFVFVSLRSCGCRVADRRGRALLHVWGVTIICGQVLYLLCADFFEVLMTMSEEVLEHKGDGAILYRNFYNSSHGFKYIGMYVMFLAALLLSTFIVRKIWFLLLGVVLAGMYWYAFRQMDMYTTVILGKSVGIVWTSVLYHGVQTGGFLILGIYLFLQSICDNNRYRRTQNDYSYN